MEEYIVKIKSCIDSDVIECGTGIVVGDNLIITPSHILVGEKHYVTYQNNDIEAILIKENNYGCALLQIQEYLPKKASIFTDDDILDRETDWEIHGFITNMQINHEMSGKGFHINEITNDQQNWNAILLNISSGVKNNYSGLSGSPVFANNRIVGIIQRQETINYGNTELKIATVSMFKELLPTDVIAENEYKKQLLKKVTEHTVNEIDKNKINRKYIPNIYVEESDYKEMVRYFADPYLFIKKSLDDLLQYDLTNYNRKFLEKDVDIVDFSKYKSILENEDNTDAVNELIQEIHNCYENMSYLRTHTPISGDYENSWIIYNNSLQYRIYNHKELLNMTTKKYLMLTKEAGQGKTNFLCDFTENFLLKKGYYVLYFNASSFSSNPMDKILQIITINSKYDIRYIMKVLSKQYQNTRKPLFIVIDGLNENCKLSDFNSQMKDFLEKCEEYPFIKVIMTTRTEFFEERFGILKDGLYQDKYIVIQMRKGSKKFKSRIFWGYLEFFNIHIIESSISGTTFDKLTNDLLFMRFFCEVNANKRNLYMYDVYAYDVFEKYTNNKCKKYSDGINKDGVTILLNEIISRMIKENNYSRVSTENFTDDSIRLLNEMIENEVIFKNETEVTRGFLTKTIETVGFTFDEYRDYCITNYLLEKYDTEEKLLGFWQYMTDEKLTIREGVQKYLFFLSHTKYKESLFDIISKVPEYDELYWNFIWDIEEKYLDYDDIQKCQNQVIENTSEIIFVIQNMVLRYDCNYYTKINIKTLICILDELLESSPETFCLITSFFPYKHANDYSNNYRKKVFYFNEIIQLLSEVIKNKVPIEIYEELIKFTIYIMSNQQYKTCCFWNYLYQHNREKTLEILKEMNSHKSQVIQSNITDILSFLLREQHDEILQQLLDENSYSQRTTMNLSEFFNSYFNDLEE